MIWGYLRETREAAVGKDPDTGLSRTALIEYLKVIYPKIKEEDWIHNKVVDTIPKEKRRNFRPDFRNEELKLVIEFDGLQHYTNIENINKDKERNKYYEENGYKAIRIPYFIQLTKKVIKQMFGIDVEQEMFPDGYGSMGPGSKCTPAFIPHKGIVRMAEEFKNYPEQYEYNMDAMKKYQDQYYVEWELLEEEYNKL